MSTSDFYKVVDANLEITCAGQVDRFQDSIGQDVVEEQVNVTLESTRDSGSSLGAESFTVQLFADFTGTGREHYTGEKSVELQPGSTTIVQFTHEWIAGDWDLADSFTIELKANVRKGSETGTPSDKAFYGLGPEGDFVDCDTQDPEPISPDATIADCTIVTNQVDVTGTATVSVTVSFPDVTELPDDASSTEALVELANGDGQVFAEEWVQGVGDRQLDITFSPTNAGVVAGDTLDVNVQLSNVAYI